MQGETQNHIRVTRSRKNVNVNAVSLFATPQLQSASQVEIEEINPPILNSSLHTEGQTNRNVRASDAESDPHNRPPGGCDKGRSQPTTEPNSPSARPDEDEVRIMESTGVVNTDSEGDISQTQGQNQNGYSKDLEYMLTQHTGSGEEDKLLIQPENSPPSVTQNSTHQVGLSATQLHNQVKTLGVQEGELSQGASDIIMQKLSSMDIRLKKLDTLESMSMEMKEDIGKIHSRVDSISNHMSGIQSDLRKAEKKWEVSEEALKARMSKVEGGCQKMENSWERCKIALHTDLTGVQSSLAKNSARLLEIENQLSEHNLNGVNKEDIDIQKKIDLAAEKKFQELQSAFNEEARQKQKTQDEHRAYEKLKDQAFKNRHNLLLFGILESASIEEDRVLVMDFFTSKMEVSKPNIEALYRLGQRNANRSRPIVVKFSNINERWDIWKKRSAIKHDPENPVWIQEDLPRKLREDNRVFLRILKTAKSMPNVSYHIKIQDFQIVFNGNRYDMNNLHLLSREISTKMAYTPYSDDVVVFFTKYSPLSNHFPCTFVIDTVTFNCVEQYLAVQRAFLAKNKPLTRRVMGTNNPADHKTVLNILRSDQPDVWKERAETLIMTALRAKFLQNGNLAQFLMDTHPRLIGEASKNEMWGIGLSLDNRDVLDSSKWKKEGNLLGISLVKVREELLANKKTTPKMNPNSAPRQGNK